MRHLWWRLQVQLATVITNFFSLFIYFILIFFPPINPPGKTAAKKKEALCVSGICNKQVQTIISKHITGSIKVGKDKQVHAYFDLQMF